MSEFSVAFVIMLALFYVAFLINSKLSETHDCEKQGHEFWNPTLFANYKPPRCRHCGAPPEDNSNE